MIHRYFRRQEWLIFRRHGKLKFSANMRVAFGMCIGPLIAIPVEGYPGGNRYVLEMDITPDSAICGDEIFSYCDFDGRVVSYIRDGCANFKSTSGSFVDRNGSQDNFEETVRRRIEQRRAADLRIFERRSSMRKQGGESSGTTDMDL